MASEKDFTPERVVKSTITKTPEGQPDAQEIPLGGQPKREAMSYQDMKDDHKVQHADAENIWDNLLKACDKALQDAGTGNSRALREVRNHVTVWRHTCARLKDAL